MTEPKPPAKRETVTQDAHTFTLSADRAIMLVIGGILAFNTFQNETRTVDNDQKLAMQELSLTVGNLTKAVNRFETFMEEPRFSEAAFNNRMTLRDSRLQAVELMLTERINFMDESKDADRLHETELRDLRREVDELEEQMKR